MTRLVVAAHIVRATLLGDTTHAADVLKGRKFRLTPKAGIVFRSVDATGGLDEIGSLASGEAEEILRQLMVRGFVVTSTRTRRPAPSAPVAIAPAPWVVTSDAPETGERTWAVAAIVEALELLTARAWYARVLAFNRATRRKHQPATEEEIQRAIVAVRWAAAWYPGRFACLETSTSAVMLLALHRRTARLRLGVAADPTRWHEWLETNAGVPVLAPGDDEVTGIFTPCE
jgi:transglutaminase superfamily protein